MELSIYMPHTLLHDVRANRPRAPRNGRRKPMPRSPDPGNGDSESLEASHLGQALEESVLTNATIKLNKRREVSGILKKTAQKLIDRGTSLEELERKTDDSGADVSKLLKSSTSLKHVAKEGRTRTRTRWWALAVASLLALSVAGIITYYFLKK